MLDSTPLVLPEGCELVADTFIVFQWQGRYCTLQNNVTMYCWGQRRSGAIEHVLERYGWTHSPELHRVSSKVVSEPEWRWLQAIFLTLRRLFDDKETGDTVGRVRWLNIMECRLVFELLRRDCYHHRRNLYPKVSALPSFLKSHGVEVDGWPEWYNAHAHEPSPTPPPPLSAPSEGEAHVAGLVEAPGTPPSGPSTSSAVSVAVATRALGAREWLSDVHIANLMFLLLHGQPRMGPYIGLMLPLEMRDLFQCVYPMTDELFVQMLRRSDDPRGAGTLLTHAKTGRGVTFAFINPNNNHWRLIVLDGMHRQVVLFDPLGRALPEVVVTAIGTCMGPSFQVIDPLSCLQAEGWNCGVWAVFIASRYVRLASAAVVDAQEARGFQPRDEQDEYVVLDAHCTPQQRQQNKQFAQQLRQQYAALLTDAESQGRLLYTTEAADAAADTEDGADEAVQQRREVSRSAGPAVVAQVDSLTLASAIRPRAGLEQVDPYRAGLEQVDPYRAGMARSAARGRRFINVPVAELVWIDLTDDVGAVEAEQEEEMEQSYEDLADNFIEFREDNVGSTDAASLRYSLPAKLQSDVLQQQITDFRAYRRQRFSLFRRGPLVEETTISGNIKSLLRFLGYLHYEQSSALAREGPHSEAGAPLDMTVFALPNISSLVLEYVEWLEQRRGKKRQAPGDEGFQPVSCATVSNYLNSLVSIVKFQLRYDLQLRDPLLDQLRNLRSQAESYTVTQKRFEKVHPEWCSWQQLQMAREKCRAAFDQMTSAQGGSRDATGVPGGYHAYLLCLRELCLLCLFTICPPPRCSIVRLLEWDKTLARVGADGRWVVDLTDVAHAASRHKTHKRKGALQLPLPAMLGPYLTRLHEEDGDGGGPVFPAPGRKAAASVNRPTGAFMSPTGFTTFVKTTFAKHTENGEAPNPSLLRSIFTTWLYGLRYDTEDAFLAQIKASSAQWKAHSEQIAATVYNKQLVYQQREFAALLRFCEAYSSRFAYDAADGAAGDKDQADKHRKRQTKPTHRLGTRPLADADTSARKRRRQSNSDAAPDTSADAVGYVVDQLVDIREDGEGTKQVLVAWEGYRRRTWEPYDSIKEQLPQMVDELEQQRRSAADDDDDGGEDGEEDSGRAFLQAFIDEHGVGASYRWNPDRVAALELAASLHVPPIRVTVAELVKRAVALARVAIT